MSQLSKKKIANFYENEKNIYIYCRCTIDHALLFRYCFQFKKIEKQQYYAQTYIKIYNICRAIFEISLSNTIVEKYVLIIYCLH